MLNRNVKNIMVFLAVALFSSSCYWNSEVGTNQAAAQLVKNEVINCVGSGVYTDLDYWSDLTTVNLNTVELQVSDPEVATKDNQLVGVEITIQARRRGDCASIKTLLKNWSHLLDDAQLVATITKTAREGIKNGTRQYTLTQLLDDRDKLANAVKGHLDNDSKQYATEIINVTIENIAIDPEYAAVLQATAKLKADQDFQERRKDLIQQQAQTDLFERQQEQLVLAEQLKVEAAKTDVEVEIARRRGEVVQASQEVYATNPQAFELRRLELLKELFGERTVYFLPEGTDPTMFFNFDGIAPVPAPVEQPGPEQ